MGPHGRPAGYDWPLREPSQSEGGHWSRTFNGGADPTGYWCKMVLRNLIFFFGTTDTLNLISIIFDSNMVFAGLFILNNASILDINIDLDK